jgi:hypothetical protein
MTLKKRLFRGKIRRGSFSPKKDFLLVNKTMEEYAPGMAETAILHSDSKYLISFDASKYSPKLEQKLKQLRNKEGLAFDYYIGQDRKSQDDEPAFDLVRARKQRRLFLEFSPKDDIEWSYIRGMFGLPARLTAEVSNEQPEVTVADR